MIDTKALRQRILDLAIQGKLVPQDPNDEPASVLLERIRKQKQQMVKDGKLKAKDIKNDTVIFKGEDSLHYEKFADGSVKCIEDEIPFDLPEGWAWCRVRDIITVCSSKRVMQSEWTKSGVPFYRAREIVKLSENGFVNNDLFISEEHYQRLKNSYDVPRAGDLMVTGVGTIGKAYIVKDTDRFYYKDASVLCFKNRTGAILSDFAKMMIESDLLQDQIHSKTYGNTVDTITITTAENYICVLPPVNEQQRIISTLISAIEIIDVIENDRCNLIDTVKSLKMRILDLAIRGQLVPQNPDDEPASILLDRVRAEKEELIKQGKIKRDKKESIIFKGEDNSYYEKMGNTIVCIDEEIPFELPVGWEFVRLKDICELISGRDLQSNEYNSENIGIPYITGASNFSDDGISIERWTDKPQVVSEIDDLLLTCKGTVGKIAFNTFGKAHIARQVMAIRNTFHINDIYLRICLEFYIDKLKGSAKGLIPGISRDDMLYLILPIPPIICQEIIVNTIAQIFKTICDIETSLN